MAAVAVTGVGVTTGGRGAAGGGGLGAPRGSKEGPDEPLRKRPEETPIISMVGFKRIFRGCDVRCYLTLGFQRMLINGF